MSRITRRELLREGSAGAGLALLGRTVAARPGGAAVEEFIQVQNPRTLLAEPIPCERIPLGEPDDYKPCLARLPRDTMVTCCSYRGEDRKTHLEMIRWRLPRSTR